MISHRQGDGPLVVFGAPGTGTTSALVGAVAARVRRDSVPAGSVLVMAPTRAAAARLRDRISAGTEATVQEPLARTPHSYAFGLLRRSRVLDGDVPPRLISGPEQDRVIADLLAGHDEGLVPAPAWPPGLGPEVRCLRGFRDELRDLLMRAVERGLGPADLAAWGRRSGRDDWVAAAQVFAEYLDVTSLATPGAYDPAGIVDAAARLLTADPELAARERERWALVAVDDAQELTAAAVRLLRLLAGDGRDVILAGDPDAATQSFRGARPGLLAEAPTIFTRADGTPARVLVLSTVHRHGPGLRAVAARVAARIGSAGAVAHRAAVPASDPASDPAVASGSSGTPSARGSRVAVHVLGSPAQEAAFVAQHLRRRHLDGRVPWAEMAVVVRSVRGTATLRRVLAASGVPVTVPSAELPVRDEPAVVPFRLALRCALDPAALDAGAAVELLAGPFGGADALALRRLRRALRDEELAGGGGRTSDDLLVEALAGPERLVTLDPATSAPARRVARVLAGGRAAAEHPDATAESVLWALWEASGLAEPWRRAALGGGPGGTRADRDLDAVVALFEAAARFVDRLPHAGPADFLAYLEGQDLPADTLAPQAPADRSVTLITAPGSAGREWEVVVVPGVHEGQWPDLRLRTSLLGAQQLADLVDGRGVGGAGSARAQRRAVLDDELRLFHVAVTRARSDLLVTAVRSDDLLPSPFLDLVDPEGGAADEGRPISEVPRTMSLPGLVAELRSAVTDPSADPQARHEAAAQLARLALAGVPGASPDDWYGLDGPSAERPLRGPGVPVRVSPSRIESFDRCPLRWLLEQCGGTRAAGGAQGIGTLIHEIAEEVPDGDEPRMQALLAERFGRLGLGSGWVARAERARAEQMVRKLAEYVRAAAADGRQLVGVEQDVEARLGQAVIRGSVDRLERDREGRVVVVDLKTTRNPPARGELARNPQLGAYQVAVDESGETSGGALLVQLGSTAKQVRVQAQPALGDDTDPGWAHRLVGTVAAGMAGETFHATVNPLCRVCQLRRSCPVQAEGRQVGE